jgi:hypothetical protein
MLADGETNQSRIAEELKVSEGLITQDIQALKAQAKERIRLHLEERLPFVFETCLVRLEKTKREAIDIYNKTEAPRIKLQALSLQYYGSIQFSLSKTNLAAMQICQEA